MNTALSPQSIEKLNTLALTFQQMIVLQLLLEWLGEPMLSEIETAFSSIAHQSLSAETIPLLLQKQWIEQLNPQAPISLTLLGLKTLKQWQKALSNNASQVELPNNLLEREGLKPSPTSTVEKPAPALVEEKTPLPTPPAFLIRSAKPTPSEKKVVKAEKEDVPTEEALTEAQWQFYETLREARYHLAQKENIKAFHVCSNAVLRSLAVHQPTDYPALEQLHGIGRTFMEKYAPTFISLTAAHMLK
jgi:superfamily II DNA helicase RecQ